MRIILRGQAPRRPGVSSLDTESGLLSFLVDVWPQEVEALLLVLPRISPVESRLSLSADFLCPPVRASREVRISPYRGTQELNCLKEPRKLLNILTVFGRGTVASAEVVWTVGFHKPSSSSQPKSVVLVGKSSNLLGLIVRLHFLSLDRTALKVDRAPSTVSLPMWRPSAILVHSPLALRSPKILANFS